MKTYTREKMFRKVRIFCRNNKLVSFVLTLISILLIVYCSLELYLNDCRTALLHDYIRNPQGKLIQKWNKDINFKTFGELTAHCKNEPVNSSCYNVKDKGETVFRQMQLSLLRMLFIVDSVCRKHNINYWIMKGTLVGAYRDKKIVPWDDDLDTSMLPADYARFRKVIRNVLPSDISFQEREEDEGTRLRRRVPHAKVRDENSCYAHCVNIDCKEKDGAQLDIILMKYFDEGNGPYAFDESNLILKKRDPNVNIPWSYISPTIDVEFEGIKVKAPRNMKGTLYYSYDAPWLKPFDPCPGGRLPVPWYSCKTIHEMDGKKKKELLETLRI